MDSSQGPRLNLPLAGDKPAPPAPDVAPDAPLEERVVAAIRTCYDPEIPVNVYDLGLIYDLKVDAAGAVKVLMTLTTPACPVAGALPADVKAKVLGVPGVTGA